MKRAPEGDADPLAGNGELPAGDGDSPAGDGDSPVGDGEPPVDDVEQPEEGQPELSPRRLILSTLAILLVLMALMALVAKLAYPQLVAVSRSFVDVLGGAGVALGYFLPDAFTIPLPNDVAAVLGVAGGLSFWEVVGWGMLGSFVGGATGFWIGRSLKRTRLVSRLLTSRKREVALFQRYGLVAVLVAAITPLPYSIFCWAAGAGGVRFDHFLAVSLVRFFRVSGYLYLIQLGLVSVTV